MIRLKLKLFLLIVFFCIQIAYPQVNKKLLYDKDVVLSNGIYIIGKSGIPYSGILEYNTNLDDEYIEVFPLKEGYIHGKWYISDESVIKVEGIFVKGSGILYQYYDYKKKSILAEVPYKKNLQDGREKRYYEDGTKLLLTNYNKGIRHGKETYWHENGSLSYAVNWVNGKKHGTEFNWYENGPISYKANWMNGERHGIREGWYENGHGKEYGVFYYGSGFTVKYHKNGNIKSIQRFKNNKEDGEFIIWYQNGEKKMEGYYLNNIVHGIWKYWDEEGKLYRHELWRNGNFVKFIK